MNTIEYFVAYYYFLKTIYLYSTKRQKTEQKGAISFSISAACFISVLKVTGICLGISF